MLTRFHQTKEASGALTHEEPDLYCVGPNDDPHKANFGYFRGLAARFPQLIHGYQWRSPDGPAEINIAWGREPEGPDRLKNVTRRLRAALDALGMGPIERTVIVGSEPGDTRILFLDEEVLARYEQTQRGKIVYGGAVFGPANLGLPIVGMAGDCPLGIIVAPRDGKPALNGVAHTGRIEVAMNFPAQVVDALAQQGCARSEMHVGITPSLEPEEHALTGEELELRLGQVAQWDHFVYRSNETGLYYPDVASMSVQQYIEAGVPPENIEYCTAGTFAAAGEGMGSSHRRSLVTGQPETSTRFFVGTQLTE